MTKNHLKLTSIKLTSGTRAQAHTQREQFQKNNFPQRECVLRTTEKGGSHSLRWASSAQYGSQEREVPTACVGPQRPESRSPVPSLSLQPTVPSLQFPVSSVQFLVSSAQFPVSSAQYPVPSLQFPVSSAQSPVPSSQSPAPSLQCPVPSLQCPVSSSQSTVPSS